MTEKPTGPVVIVDYKSLLTDISTLLENARRQAVRQINTVIVQTYWNIGEYLVQYEQKGRDRAEYGAELLKRLSNDLISRFGKGFTERNLRAMRQFYLAYPQLQGYEKMSRIYPEIDEKWHTTGAELSWSHYRILMRISEETKRSFYEIETVRNNWSVREMQRQINSMLFERIALSKDKEGVKELAKRGEIIAKPEDAIRDPYVLEFLGLKEESIYTEKRLESALIANLQIFLLELGRGFTFVARQKRISINNEHYYIDLVLFNRILRCVVLIDLKLGKFDHADVGQMNFYLKEKCLMDITEHTVTISKSSMENSIPTKRWQMKKDRDGGDQNDRELA